MKPIYESDFASSFWCQERSLLYHKVHKIPDSEDELHYAQNKLSEVYLHLKTNDIEFWQIYHPSERVNLKITHMNLITKFAYFLKSQDKIIDDHCKGVSVIYYKGLLSKMINHFIKLFANKIPVKIVKDEDAAYEFLNLKKCAN